MSDVKRHLRPLALIAISFGSVLPQLSPPATAQETATDDSTGGNAIFSEDFSNGIDRWELTDPKAWKLSESSGNKTFGLMQRISDYQPKVRSPHNIALIKDLDLSDFVMTFKVRSTKDTGNHRDCCVFFCHQDPEHFYYAHLGARPDPNSGQIMIVDGAPRIALTKNENLVPWDNEWHTVKIVRESKSGKIEIYFDDMDAPHMTATNKVFKSGRVGIGSFDDMNEFDDVNIYALPSVTETSENGK